MKVTKFGDPAIHISKNIVKKTQKKHFKVLKRIFTVEYRPTYAVNVLYFSDIFKMDFRKIP